MRGTRVVLICLIALSFLLAPARQSWAGPHRDTVCQGCGDGPGCTPCSAGGGSSSYSRGPGIAWGGMTKRNMESLGRECRGKPLCYLVLGSIGLVAGAITDVPYYAVKGVGYGLYYGGKGLYYGGMGLGKGLAYTGRSIGRGIAYPFNRPPKPKLPPTTWEQYKHDVLRHQKALTKANKANRENQRWCINRVPLEVSAGRSEWETRCNPGEAISRAALPKTVLADEIAAVVTESPPTTPPAVNVSPSAAEAAIAPAAGAIPALQDSEKALGENEAQAKKAGESGFDDPGPMAGKPTPAPVSAGGAAVDSDPGPEPESLLGQQTTPAAGTKDRSEEISVGIEPGRNPAAPSAPESTTTGAIPKTGNVPADVSSKPESDPAIAASPKAIPTASPPHVNPTAPSPQAAAPTTPGKPATTSSSPAPTPKFALPKEISVEDGGDSMYRSKVLRDLELISRTTSGRTLLKSIKDSGQKLRIHNDMFRGKKHGHWTWTDPPPTTASAPGYLKGGKPGDKIDAQIGYDPDSTNLRGRKGGKYYSAKWAGPPNASADVWLFHEMVHADDFMNGRYDATLIKNMPPHDKEKFGAGELRAVGLIGTHAYSENVYRSERLRPDGKPFLKREFY